VGAARRKPGQPDHAGQGQDAASSLSAFEEALRQALASLPRDQVIKCIAAALPIQVLIDENVRLHGGKVRKVSVSMPEELAEAVRARTGTGGFSRYVTDAVQEQVRQDLLDDLAAELEAQYGPVDEKLVEQAMREWPDYKER
jgi:Arc/MetJ-type ribon-helix-helix transcriptional regulator